MLPKKPEDTTVLLINAAEGPRGLAIMEALAKRGFNILNVYLPHAGKSDAYETLLSRFPAITTCNFEIENPKYSEIIEKLTSPIDILIFNHEIIIKSDNTEVDFFSIELLTTAYTAIIEFINSVAALMESEDNNGYIVNVSNLSELLPPNVNNVSELLPISLKNTCSDIPNLICQAVTRLKSPKLNITTIYEATSSESASAEDHAPTVDTLLEVIQSDKKPPRWNFTTPALKARVASIYKDASGAAFAGFFKPVMNKQSQTAITNIQKLNQGEKNWFVPGVCTIL